MALIRPELPQEFDRLNDLLRTAFRREAEARLVDRLRASGKIVSALVAEDKGYLLGHIMFSKIAVSGGAAPVTGIALAPLTVMPAFQRLGIGSALVSAGLETCRSQSEPRVFVYGDPVYYARFGFTAAARFGLKSSSPEVEKYFRAKELEPRAFAGISGTIRYGHEFDDLE